MLFERGVPFRYDWEHVITPVVDYLLTRADVDADRIALYGISQAGYWVPRALAFEHRIAAAIADPGVFDAFEPWRKALPPALLDCFDRGDRDGFDRSMDEGMQYAPASVRQNWAWRAKPYGLSSAYDVCVEAQRYNLSTVVDRIRTPLLITNPEGEQFWQGQSERLYAALSGAKDLVAFSAREGADGHCEPMARTLLEQRMFDWLDDQLSAHST
jgi:hypothetical protein